MDEILLWIKNQLCIHLKGFVNKILAWTRNQFVGNNNLDVVLDLTFNMKFTLQSAKCYYL
jgi:hypothetical protein